MQIWSMCFALGFVAVLGASQCGSAAESVIAELGRSVHRGGVDALVARIADGLVPAPEIPSAWRQQQAIDAATKARVKNARDFGAAVAAALVDEATAMRVGERKHIQKRVRLLSHLVTWLGTTDGYGNLLLCYRANDIAGVGFGRLVADQSVSMDDIDALVASFPRRWRSFESRTRVLNLEAGAHVFNCSSDSELEERWDLGIYLSTAAGKERLVKQVGMPAVEDLGLPKDDVILQVGAFFDACLPGERATGTVVELWGMNCHRRIAMGLESRNWDRANALYEFRKAVGGFPKTVQISPEQRAAALREKQLIEEKGGQIVPFERAYRSEEEAAFNQAWIHALEQRGLGYEEQRRRWGIGSKAWEAYHAINTGKWGDIDESIRLGSY